MDNTPKKPQSEMEDLGHIIEEEVRKTVSTLADTVSTVMQSMGETVRQNATQGSKRYDEAMRKYKENAQKPSQKNPYTDTGKVTDNFHVLHLKDMKNKVQQKLKKNNYTKKAKGALSEAASFFYVAAILFTVSLSVLRGDPASAIVAIVGVFFVGGAVQSYCKGKRFQRVATYMNVLRNRTNCPVAEMAAASGKSVQYVSKDLQRHITTGDLENLFLAPDGKRVFASELALNLYLEQQKSAPPSEQKETSSASQEGKNVTTLDECRLFTVALHRQSELIDDGSVSEQLNKIETHMSLMIGWLEKHPEKEERVRRFTSYYLPTTLKLLETYNEVDPHAENSSETAANIQRDIVGILYSINTAFIALENSLMEDTALNVMAEISAMETMLAQDGLAKSDF